MAAVVELLVPCRPIVVEVRLGSEEALTPLEIGFVEAIAAGEHDFARLARMFGIGRRLALDLVFDLWQAQLLLVDTTQRRLDLADDIAEAVRRDGIEALRDARIGREQTRQLMQEQLTGHVLSARHHRSGVVIQQLVVPASEPPSAQDITETDLIAALRDDIAHDDTLRSARRVLSARLALRAAPRGGRSFWLQIRVEASVADATEDIDLAVLHHEALPHLTRMAMAQRIVAAVEQAPQSDFANTLRDGASKVLKEPIVDPVLDLSHLISWAGGLAALEQPGARDHRQHQLESTGARLERWLVDGESGDHCAVPRVGGLANEAAIDQLIRDARDQLVIVAPRPEERRLRTRHAALEAALQRGVQVFLLWGSDREARLADDVRTSLVLLRARYPRRFFTSASSAKTQTDLVVQDDRVALLTSAGALSRVRPHDLKLGVLLTATVEDLPCRPIEQLLKWCRDSYPESAAASGMLILAEDFTGRAARPNRAPIEFPPQPGPPPASDSAAPVGPLDVADLRVWQGGWENYAVQMRHLLDARGATGLRLVREAEHRLLLNRALRTAERRLLIMGTTASASTLNADFLDALERRLARMVEVALVFARVHGDAEQLLARLTNLGPADNPITIVAPQPTHAGLLVADDMTVISGFELLSSDGYFDQAGSRRRRRSSHVGVMIRDPAFADKVLDEVAGSFPDALRDFGRFRPRRRPTAIPSAPFAANPHARAAADLLRQLGQAPADADTRAMVRDAITASSDPPAFGQLLVGAGLPGELTEAAAATLVLHGYGDAEQRSALRALLCRSAWSEDRLIDAATLAEDGVDGVPAAELAVLAAAAGTSAFADVVIALMDAGLGADIHADAALIGAVACAVHGDRDGLDLVPNDGAGAIITALDDYCETTHRPLPLDDLVALTELARGAEALDACWNALDAALTASRARDYTSTDWMNSIVAALHDEAGFGPLEAAVKTRDHAAVVGCVAGFRGDPDKLLRAAEGRAGTQHIDGRGRPKFMRPVAEVVQAARAVARCSLPEDRELHDAVVECARALQAAWPETSDAELPAVLAYAHRRLRPLLQWTVPA